MQYAMLAIGGLRVLRAMGIDIPRSSTSTKGTRRSRPSSSFARAGSSGLGFEEALASARRRVVFTTHTPVPAGNEHYDVRAESTRCSARFRPS